MEQNERSSAFVTITCSCGRGLRAKVEQVGTEVRCWDCHKMVLVPLPYQGQRVAREMSENAMTVIQGPGLNSVLLGAAVITAVLAIPYAGLGVAAIALMMGASAYGEIIRRVSRGSIDRDEPGWQTTLVPWSIPKFIVCSLFAAGTVVPLWVWNAKLHRSPHLDWIGYGLASAIFIIMPLLMLSLYARSDEDVRLGARRSWKICSRHPYATLLALLVVPLTLVLVEVLIGMIIYLPGGLAFYALDYMPMPASFAEPVIFNGIPHYHLLDYRNFPPSLFYNGYFDGLHHGYSFVGAIPPSLSLPTRNGLTGNAIGMPDFAYLFVRLLFVMIIITCLLAAFAVQARWLGSITALERMRAI